MNENYYYDPQNLPLNFKNHLKDYIGIPNLIEATSNISEYSTLSERVIIPSNILYMQLLLGEALSSTRIEGTQVDLRGFLENKDELDVHMEKNRINFKNNPVAGNKFYDMLDVVNYMQAFNASRKNLDEDRLPLSNRVIRNIHREMMGVIARGKNDLAGEFRDRPVFIGKDGDTIKTAEFVPPIHSAIERHMDGLEVYINAELNKETEYHEIIKIAIIHAQFETIHPFIDGNGRVGRVLIPLYLYYKKIIKEPNLFISKSLEKNKYKYYDYLNGTRDNTEIGWSEWIDFFIKSLNSQLINEIKMIREMDELYKEAEAKIKNKFKTTLPLDILNAIFENPIFTAKEIEKKLGGPSYGSINNYLKYFIDAGMLHTNKQKRNRKYYYYEVMDILEKYN